MCKPGSRMFALKKPCANCPFRKDHPIRLSPGRLESIIQDITENDMVTFRCHKTVCSKTGGDWDDEGNYHPSGRESMCAGAAAYLMKVGRPNVAMRVGFVTGIIRPEDWDDAKEMIIDPQRHVSDCPARSLGWPVRVFETE